MLTLYSLLIVLFIMTNAFFAGAELALTSLNKIRLRHLVEVGDKRAIAINDLLQKEGQFLGITLVGTNISVIISSALLTQLLYTRLGTNAAFVSSIVMTSLILVFGEVVPKTIFQQSSNAISLRIIYPLKFMFKLLYPIIFLVTNITNFVLFPFKRKKEKSDLTFMTKKDIEIALGSSGKTGLPTPDKSALIQRIFRLGRTTVGGIMVPVNQATLINVSEEIKNLKDIAARTRFSRFPVYENQKSNIIGTINIYDILFAKEEKEILRYYITAPFFINERESVDNVLTILRQHKKPMAIVINDSAVVVGVVTIEDLLEEIVGEIEG